MCNWFKPKTPTIEEIISSNSVGMTDKEKAQYWYEINKTSFSLLGKVDDIKLYGISVEAWIKAARKQYPSLTDIKIADMSFKITTLETLHDILTKDWTNLVPYDSLVYNCDKYASELYNHLCLHYMINSVVPVWGNTDQGYHGFNLAVLINDNDGSIIARLIEPQKDTVFIKDGPLGCYVPMKTAEELGVLQIGQ